MCPHTAKYVSSYYYICVLMLLYMRLVQAAPRCRGVYAYICVRILLYTCPHTTIYVSSYYYICVLSKQRLVAEVYTLIYVSAYCVLILLYMRSVQVGLVAAVYSRTQATCCTRTKVQNLTLAPACGLCLAARYSSCLHYSYKSTNTDTCGAAAGQARERVIEAYADIC
jgi:hypothetical protein